MEVHGSAQRCMVVCRGMHRGVWRGVQRCTEGWIEVCKGYVEVQGGVQKGVWRGAEVYTRVCRGAWRSVQRWLPLATIDLVDDIREFEV